jgi:basic membrane protein A and related proteins
MLMKKTYARAANMRRLIIVTFMICMMTVLASCKGGENADEKAAATESGKSSQYSAYKVVAILPGSIDDHGWNATAYTGIKLIENDFGIRAEYVENVQVDDAATILGEYGRKKYDLVFGHGIQFEEAARKVAKKYPETFYMIINSESGVEPNVGGVAIREWEGGYIAGVLSALETNTNHISSMGAVPLPVIEGTMDAFEAGAKSVNPSVKVDKAYINTWNDIRKGRQVALDLINNGSDVLFCTANEVGLGVIDIAKANNVKAIGYIAPQNNIAPDTVVSSVTYSIDKLYVWVVKEMVDDKLKARGYTQGWADGVLQMQWSDSISAEKRLKVENTIKLLSEGKISNPYKPGD